MVERRPTDRYMIIEKPSTESLDFSTTLAGGALGPFS
jgi:hypothetical protein